MAIHPLDDEEIIVEGYEEVEQSSSGPSYSLGDLLGLRFVAAFLLPVSLVWMVVSLLFLRWRAACVGGALFVSALAGIFSPRFGISILSIYLVMHVQEEGGLLGGLRNRVHSSFRRF